MKGWIRSSWIPYIERIPPNRLEDFLETIAGHYLKTHRPLKDGTIRFPLKRLEIDAVNRRSI